MRRRLREGKVAAVWTMLLDEGDLPRDSEEVSMYGSTTPKLTERDTACGRWMLLYPRGMMEYVQLVL